MRTDALTLAFAETAAEAAAVPQGCAIVALTPRAQVELIRAERPFRRPDDYVGWEEIETIGEANFAAVERIADAVDDLAAAHLAAARTHELRPARWHFMQLKQIVDGVSIGAFRLRAILERDRPESVLRFAAGSRTARVLDALVPDAAVLSEPPPPARPSERAAAAPRPRLLDRVLARARRGRDRGQPVLLLDPGYSTPLVARELARRGQPTRFLQRPVADTGRLEELWSAVAGDARIRGELLRDGVDLWPAAEPELREIVAAGIPGAVGVFEHARREMLRVAPAAALAAGAASARKRAACEAARSLGIPVVIARHGEYGARAIPMTTYQDPEAADVILCWGEWEAANLARHAGRPVETVVVGSPMVEEAVQAAPPREEIRALLGVEPDERVAVYASGTLAGDEWYASRLRLDDSMHFTRRVEITTALAAIPDLAVLVKAHPADRPDPVEGAKLGPSVRVVYEPSRFSELVNLADVVVLDSTGTTIAQALFGVAPVVVVDHPLYAWEPGVREHLSQHGVTFTSVADLAGAVEQARSDRATAAAAREPIVASGPESAAVRAARAVVEIASRERRP